MSLHNDPARWPLELQIELRERWNIMEFDGRILSPEAYLLAVADIRRRYEPGVLYEAKTGLSGRERGDGARGISN